MSYSSQSVDFVVNLIAYVILIEPHPVYNFMDFMLQMRTHNLCCWYATL